MIITQRAGANGRVWRAFESIENQSPRPTGGIYVRAGGDTEDIVGSAASGFKTSCSDRTSRRFEDMEPKTASIAHLSTHDTAIMRKHVREALIQRPGGILGRGSGLTGSEDLLSLWSYKEKSVEVGSVVLLLMTLRFGVRVPRLLSFYAPWDL
jgi:hypothetical protein